MSCFVMIHGGAHGSRRWGWSSGRCSPSTSPAGQGFDSFADAAAATDIVRNDLSDVVIVARSMGGMTALRAADPSILPAASPTGSAGGP